MDTACRADRAIDPAGVVVGRGARRRRRQHLRRRDQRFALLRRIALGLLPQRKAGGDQLSKQHRRSDERQKLAADRRQSRSGHALT